MLFIGISTQNDMDTRDTTNNDKFLKGVRTIRNSITTCHSSFAVCQGAFHRVLVPQEVRLQMEGRLQEVPGYQQVEEVRQAHRSWVGERVVHPWVHRGLNRWGGKGGHPEGMEALNM
jgi:hypothetical protein